MRIFVLEIGNYTYEFFVYPREVPTWCDNYDDWDLCVAFEKAADYLGRRDIEVMSWEEVEYDPEMQV